MRYYAKYDADGTLTQIGINTGGTEITKEEYDRLLDEIKANAEILRRYRKGEIKIDDVPPELRHIVNGG